MPVLSKLENCPTEVLEEIVLSLVESTFLGPPSEISALLLLSKSIWRQIALEFNPHLYSRVFQLKFDVQAAVRRLGDQCGHAVDLAQELIRRCIGLKRLRNNCYARNIVDVSQGDDLLRVDLWMVFLMFIESDGKNATQLIDYAMVDRLVCEFVSPGGMFHDGKEVNNGWIIDSEVNALMAWIIWLTDGERVYSETHEERQLIFQAFGDVFTGSFMYPSSFAPATSLLIDHPTLPPLPPFDHAFPLAAFPISPPCIIPCHYGFRLTLARPLLTSAALLICAVRLEVAGAKEDIRVTGAQTAETGVERPTLEDYLQVREPKTKLVRWDEDVNAGSIMHEHDWMRLLSCYEPLNYPTYRGRVFTPGMLDGLWEGKHFGLQRADFNSLISPQEGEEIHPLYVYPTPMQFRLREHHQKEVERIVDFDDITCDGFGTGVFNAWFPKDTSFAETGDELSVFVPNSTQPSKYKTYNPSAATHALDAERLRADEHHGLYGKGVWDIILTAETTEEFGQVWGHKRYHGRVRDWDGLIVLVCETMDGESPFIFRGYVHGGQNLVGRWRETETPVELPGWEGAWSMTKT